MRLKLESGTTFAYDNKGNRICTGSQMGRRNDLPDDPTAPIKLHMERLRFVDGDYDTGGAYWGGPATVFCAHNESEGVRIFVRGSTGLNWPQPSREVAKFAVRKLLPNATFYR